LKDVKLVHNSVLLVEEKDPDELICEQE